MAKKEHNANYGSGTEKKETPSGHLSANERHEASSSEFGLPKERKYPMPDKPHARNAKARASEEEHKGHISSAEKEKIDRKADKILGEDVGDAFRGPRDVSDLTKFGPPLGDSVRERQSRGEHVSGRDLARARDEMNRRR